MEKLIVIVGPTGVGKTKLSIALAKKLNAEIINGDSVAVYRGLDIGSAKPTVEEQEGIPHHLIDICDVTDEYSVFSYQQDARRVIDDIIKQGKRVIIVGGTGLYIKALLYDYRFTEGTTHHSYDEFSNEELLSKLSQYTKENLPHVHNRKRLVRLLNKYENEEEMTSYKDHLLYPCTIIGLTTERENLYQKINQRVCNMIEQGLLSEIEKLKPYYPTSRVLNSAIGYKEFRDYFSKEKTLAEVITQIQLDSRRFAKRQYTFFNHQIHPHWISVCFGDFSKTISDAFCYIQEQEK